MSVQIDQNTLVEDIVVYYPEAVDPLMRHGIKCIECGEPIWGTVGEAAAEKGLNSEALNSALEDIKRVIKEKLK